MKKRKATRLTIAGETIRHMSPDYLHAAAGGALVVNTHIITTTKSIGGGCVTMGTPISEPTMGGEG